MNQHLFVHRDGETLIPLRKFFQMIDLNFKFAYKAITTTAMLHNATLRGTDIAIIISIFFNDLF